MHRAHLNKILPSFIPGLLEVGIPTYEDSNFIKGENRLTLSEIRALFVASAFLGTLEHAMKMEFDSERVRGILSQSISELSELSLDEKNLSFQLINRFFNFKIIRADHPFDDWLCEALWEQFQTIPYDYPSAMSAAVSSGLNINRILNNCSLEY